MMSKTICIEQKIINHLADKDERLAAVIELIGPIEYRSHANNESFFVETIIGQMLSNKVADKLVDRLYDLCEGQITADRIESLGIERIKSIGISMQKAQYIVLFCDYIKKNPDYLYLLESQDDATVIKSLTSLRGIGNWTAKMYLLFVLNRPSVIPFEDGAFLQSYKWLYNARILSPKAIERRCKKWHPYESYGARYLYRVLDYGMTRYPTLADAQENWSFQKDEI